MKNEENKYSELFLYLSIIFVVCLLLSNILASKLLKVGNFSVTAGVLVFPISYIINDILSEVYGYKKTKKIIVFGFIMNLFMVIIFSLAIIFPSPSFYNNESEFALILGSTKRNTFASLIAYLFGSLVNSKVLVNMKKKEGNKFGRRVVVSTILGELIDSTLFVFIVFLFKLNITQMLTMIIIQVVLKTLYEVVCLPLTTLIVNKIKIVENIN